MTRSQLKVKVTFRGDERTNGQCQLHAIVDRIPAKYSNEPVVCAVVLYALSSAFQKLMYYEKEAQLSSLLAVQT